MNTENRKFRLHDAQSGAAITVRITPRAARNGISEILDDGTIKVRLAVPNSSKNLDRALVSYLAEILEIKPSQLDIVAGISGVDKLVTIVGMKASDVQKKIISLLDSSN
jgi:hypothetical protein